MVYSEGMTKNELPIGFTLHTELTAGVTEYVLTNTYGEVTYHLSEEDAVVEACTQRSEGLVP